MQDQIITSRKTQTSVFSEKYESKQNSLHNHIMVSLTTMTELAGEVDRV